MKLSVSALALLATMAGASAALAQDITIGLQDDPDLLDPDRSRTFVGKVVFQSMCDTLVDVDADLKYVPELATRWDLSDDQKDLTFHLRDGVTFQDGTPFNAEAVKANFDRSMTLEGSLRKAELISVDNVEVIDPLTVTLHLKAPDSTLMSQLTGQPGMMLSPTAFAKDDFAQNPVCVGPYKFQERVQNDKIVLEKDPTYYDADHFHFDTVTYMPVPDATVRLANLRSGAFQLIERVAPSDVASVKNDPELGFATVPSLGWRGLEINLNGNSPMAKDVRVREAFDWAIDRDVINQVAGQGLLQPDFQPFSPLHFAYDDSRSHPRDVEKAKALLKEAGYEHPTVEIIYGNNTLMQQVMELIQAMAGEAGFDVKLKASEFSALQAALADGNFDIGQAGWAGRVDPDGNFSNFALCDSSLNDTGYCSPEVDALFAKARETSDEAERKEYYKQFMDIMMQERPYIFLYNELWAYAYSDKLEGFVPYSDGVIRLKDVSLAQ
ncbi:ABC transporter substrate-binding protein [Martelella alba]|uniref:ABC transporter substrate-binding protein n=1 Tax=Martelella alba TaxID=2590451 RepID=A0A506U1Y0_9HYPH|nr:ABC transporter substrate-binding protein [Martelella alba]TPW26579.1 ABC transporter substrate-binding protein [Martelella alba]